jgi:hypothetical protein
MRRRERLSPEVRRLQVAGSSSAAGSTVARTPAASHRATVAARPVGRYPWSGVLRLGGANRDSEPHRVTANAPIQRHDFDLRRHGSHEQR